MMACFSAAVLGGGGGEYGVTQDCAVWYLK